MMTARKKKNFIKNMGGSVFGAWSSIDEAKRALQANKYENDEIFPVINAMSREKPQYPFIVAIQNWSEILKPDFPAFSLLCPDALEILFNIKQNPLYILRAYQNCREYKLPIPDWVLAYLDHSVGELLDIGDSKDPARETYAALGFNKRGSGTLYKRFLDDEIRFKAVCQVVSSSSEETEHRMKIHIYGDVADRYKVEVGTIQSWYYEYKPLFNPPR